jgi:tetratricopeptide (TPR) repeat protein
MSGMYFRGISEFEKAIQRLLQAAELEPANAIWRMEIGNLYADQHNIQAGLTQYQKAAALDPNNPMIWQEVAEYSLYHELEVRRVGLPAARQAVALAPDSARFLDTIGRVMVGLGDSASAERFLQQAIGRDPDFSAATLHLGQFYLSQGQTAQAEYYLARAAQPQGQDTEANLIAERLLDRYFGRH